MEKVPEKSAQATRPKHAFTVEEFQRLAEAGIVAGDERIELIGGKLTMAIGPGITSQESGA